MGKKNQPVVTFFDSKLKEKFRQSKKKKVHFEDFLREFLGNFVAEKTRQSYFNDLKIFFHFLSMGDEKITHPKDIGSYHFTLYRDWMIHRQYSPATIGRRMVCIRSFMKWALSHRLIDHNPLEAVKLPKIQTISPTQAFDDREVVEMTDAPNVQSFSGNTHRLVLVLLFHLGLRRSEIVQIKIRDIIQERHHTALQILGKGHKKRLLPLNPHVLQEIADYRKRFFTHTNQNLQLKDYLVQTNSKRKNQRPCDGSTIYRIVTRYAQTLGIRKDVSPHSCRATVISHLLDTQKSPIRDVADFAGHQQTTTTERYDKKRKGLNDSVAYEVNYSDSKAS